MKLWITHAFLSMLFAGLTAVIAKKGLDGISGDLGLAIRTCFVFLFTLTFALFVVPTKDWTLLKTPNWLWLGCGNDSCKIQPFCSLKALQIINSAAI